MYGLPLNMDVRGNMYLTWSPKMPPFGLFEERESSDGQNSMQKVSYTAIAKPQEESPG